MPPHPNPHADATIPDDPAEVRRWAERLGTTEDALRSAIAAVGRRVGRILDQLGAGQAAQQQDG